MVESNIVTLTTSDNVAVTDYHKDAVESLGCIADSIKEGGDWQKCKRFIVIGFNDLELDETSIRHHVVNMDTITELGVLTRLTYAIQEGAL
jgi:hypothetical protein